ncbi:MAG: bifunctional ADP-heptose synthase [Planctomycetota bacterium]|nr:bifunctional ADP-heptose synthase [Planctomycetota bacterium]
MADTALKRYQEIVGGFHKLSVAVVGDLVADIYIYGKPSKLSREAPVMIVKFEEEKLIPGSAGNSVSNLAVLGAKVHAIGAIGNDEMGERLKGMMEDLSVDTRGLIVDPDLTTVTKTRILAGDLHTSKQQVIRIDREPESPASAKTEEAILSYAQSLSAEVQGLLVSDYGYNLVSPSSIAAILEAFREKVIVADSRRQIAEYRGAWMVKPNESEAIAATGIEIETEADARKAGAKLLEKTGARSVLLTRGNQGMILFQPDEEPESIPVFGEQDIVDVTGAGDTVVSVALLALAAGGNFSEAARLANYAASVVVMKRGAGTVTPEELLGAVAEDLADKRDSD